MKGDEIDPGKFKNCHLPFREASRHRWNKYYKDQGVSFNNRIKFGLQREEQPDESDLPKPLVNNIFAQPDISDNSHYNKYAEPISRLPKSHVRVQTKDKKHLKQPKRISKMRARA